MGNNLRKYLWNYDNSYVEYSRDSFSQRICDDLCELILQYLSLEDKFRFECVSHQFQKTAFKRQNELRIDYMTRNIFVKISVKSFEELLKKCLNITSVYIKNFRYLRNIEYNDCIELITSNCQSLTKINLDSSLINNQLFEKFINTFGARLKFFECGSLPCSKILKTFKSIEVLDLNICDYKDIQEHKFTKLKNLSVHFYEENSNYLTNFIRNNHGIQKLSVTLDTNDPVYAKSVLMELANFKNLVHFSFTGIPLNDGMFYKALTRMAVNCPQLKSIVCLLNTYSYNYYKINELLSPLKPFTHLKSLDLSFELSINDEQNRNSSGSSGNIIQPLTGFEGLTQLSLSFYNYDWNLNNIRNNIIEKIVNYFVMDLTKLRILDIKSEFYLSRGAANILSQLPHLEIFSHLVCGKTMIYKLPRCKNESFEESLLKCNKRWLLNVQKCSMNINK